MEVRLALERSLRTAGSLEHGDHACLLYNSTAKRTGVLVCFIREGLAGGKGSDCWSPAGSRSSSRCGRGAPARRSGIHATLLS
jgi:hypothetical protein